MMVEPTEKMLFLLCASESWFLKNTDRLQLYQEKRIRRIFLDIPVHWNDTEWIYQTLDKGFTWNDNIFTENEIVECLKLAFDTMVSYIKFNNQINRLVL